VIDAPLPELEALAALLKERVGLHVRKDGFPALRLALAARLEDAAPPAADAAGYLEVLRSPAGDEELRRLLPLVTVGMTEASATNARSKSWQRFCEHVSTTQWLASKCGFRFIWCSRTPILSKAFAIPFPLRRTKTMPVRHARSERRGRPPVDVSFTAKNRSKSRAR
jgi:hypothetical protein